MPKCRRFMAWYDDVTSGIQLRGTKLMWYENAMRYATTN